MSEVLSQDQIDELFKGEGYPSQKHLENKSVSERCRKFFKSLSLLELYLFEKLNPFESQIAIGTFNIIKPVFLRKRKDLREVKLDIEKWEHDVAVVLKKNEKNDPLDNDILEIKEEFKKIAADKTEDGINDLQLALEKIEEFDNYVSDNLIIDVEFLMNECVNNFSETKDETWNRIYSALIVQKDSILSVRNQILEMVDEAKGCEKKINYKELKFSEQTVYSFDEIVAAYEKFIIFQMESTVFDKNWFLVTKENLDFYKTFSAKDMYYKMIEELACGDFTNQKITAVKVIDSKTFKTVDSFILEK